ncbi:MAG: PrsW family glutamic-type intramembrane protease [Gemmatimonadales bacterium]
MTHTPAIPSASSHQWFLFCLAGPDRGKRLAITQEELIIGRAADANLLSDDPDVTERFARLKLEKNGLRIWGLADTLPYVDGHSRMEAVLGPGHQVRIGRSLWQVSGPGSGEGVLGLVSKLGDRLSLIAGLEKPSDFKPREMFSEVIKRHQDEEVETYFTVGTSATTPALLEIDANWPRPWVFIRVLAISLLAYLGFLWGWDQFQNIRLLPGLIMTGSIAMPFALLILCFEANVPRNVSLYQVIKLVLWGGVMSIVVSLFFFRWTGLSNWLGAAAAGIVEETGKALTLVLVVTRPRYRWTLNGLLFGAAVGTGFAVFESAGYALDFGLQDNSIDTVTGIIKTRGLLSILGGHTLWTALVGAALWRVRGTRSFTPGMFFDTRFLRVFGLCVAMHMVWNSPLRLPASGKYLILGVVVWFLIIEMIHAGLREVKAAQIEEATGQHAASAG